ncbi:unnamed protein product [Lactuca saligna]|uniref:EF-hand domain-containing protein n=1 Tax=Lactuca saligna TaxID=75948 RepID=A0AA35URB7_LACSI|nr:unnamed protein product [Lactuca saligna]
MMEKQGIDSGKDAMEAYRVARMESEDSSTDEQLVADRVSSALINRVEAMLQNLEKEIDDVDAKIGDRWRVLDKDYDGKVTHEEMASAAIYLKDTLGKEGVQELITNLSKDKGHPRYFTTCKNLLQNRMHLIPKDKVPSIWQPNKAQFPIPSKSTPHPNNFVFIPINLTCFGMCMCMTEGNILVEDIVKLRNRAEDAD